MGLALFPLPTNPGSGLLWLSRSFALPYPMRLTRLIQTRHCESKLQGNLRLSKNSLPYLHRGEKAGMRKSTVNGEMLVTFGELIGWCQISFVQDTQIPIRSHTSFSLKWYSSSCHSERSEESLISHVNIKRDSSLRSEWHFWVSFLCKMGIIYFGWRNTKSQSH